MRCEPVERTILRTFAITSNEICRPPRTTSPPVIASPGPTLVVPTSCEKRKPSYEQLKKLQSQFNKNKKIILRLYSLPPLKNKNKKILTIGEEEAGDGDPLIGENIKLQTSQQFFTYNILNTADKLVFARTRKLVELAAAIDGKMRRRVVAGSA